MNDIFKVPPVDKALLTPPDEFVCRSFVSKCESGERRVDIIELADFAKIYEKPLDFFLS